jgi:N-acetylglucosamine-6-phosphate deacetylase
VKGNELVEQDLWVSSATGKIVRSQEVFYGENVVPDITINLGGKIIAPGLIDVQLNGAFGFNFSQIREDPSSYGKILRQVNKSLIQTGVTSYLPTLTSERVEVYHQVGNSPQIPKANINIIHRHYPSSAPQALTA